MQRSVTWETDMTRNWKFWQQRRYILVLMLFFGMANMFINRTNLSVAIVAMTKNSTDGKSPAPFDWNSKQQGVMLSSFFYGYIVTQIPGGILTQHVPVHHVFGIPIGIASVVMLLTPVAASFGFYAVTAVRILEGLAFGMVIPAMMAILSKWIPPIERSRMSVICDAGISIGTVIGMIGSGLLTDYFGWESIFYVFGVLSIIWWIIWSIIIRESPENDPWISQVEKNYILKSLQESRDDSKTDKSVPWCAMVTSGPVWALLFALFAHCWGAYTLMTQMPTYLSDVMSINLRSNGVLSCLPFIVASILGPFAGLASETLEKKKMISRLNTRRSFLCVAFCIQCVFMMAAAYIVTPVGSITCLTIAMGVCSLAYAGFGPNLLDIAPSYSGILFGLINTVAGISGVASPLLAGFIVQNQSEEEWKIVFYIAAAVYLACAVLYWLMASAQVQPWAKITEAEEMIPMKNTSNSDNKLNVKTNS